MALAEEITRCLRDFARPLAHMRAQIQANRFGLIFGSGLSRSFGIRTWAALVDAISQDERVHGQDLFRNLSHRVTLPYKTELLFQNYRRTRLMELQTQRGSRRESEYRIMAEWLTIVAEHLYKDAPEDFGTAVRSHPYLRHYLSIINSTPFTITYNFDDFLEQALNTHRGEEDRKLSRGYEVVTNPWTQFRRQTAVIYHPNGIVPQELMETPVDRIVFSEASYAERLIGAMAGDYASILNHLSKTTCLFIGLSLEDEVMRNLLVQSARTSPGNYHYYIYYLESGESISEGHKEAIRQANFAVYNLITLFLDNSLIASLGRLLDIHNTSDNVFADMCDEVGCRAAYRYYITGSLGVGKSTAVNQYRNLTILDEWLEPRLPVLRKPWDQLTDEELAEADRWLSKQFRLKNDNLRHERVGVFMVDRPPLDPLAFTPRNDWPGKATELLDAICPGEADWSVAPGQVIVLTGDAKELAIRLLLTKREGYTEEKLRLMEETILEVYEGPGVVVVDTRGLAIGDVAKRIGEIIHLESYEEFDLHERLLLFREKRG